MKKPGATKLLVLMGTRPEVIKLAPVILKLKESDTFETRVCFTAQHRDMCRPFLRLFSIEPDYDLDVMIENQSLSKIGARTIERLDRVFDEYLPDAIVIQGDTTSAVASSLAAFHRKISVFHIEAGLRSYSKNEPFPEEVNRQIITRIADYHFAPTERARAALISEGISDSTIFVTGNTVIDTLEHALAAIKGEEKDFEELDYKNILVTVHRRENLEHGIPEICEAINEIVKKYEDVRVLFPVHENPAVRKRVLEHIGRENRIVITEQLDYVSMIKAIKKSFVVMTDSGGLQEEVPYIGRPLIILRNITERTEIVERGSAVLAGASREKILIEFDRLYNDRELRRKMSRSKRIYGDGRAAWRIARIMETIFKGSKGEIESIKEKIEYAAGKNGK